MTIPAHARHNVPAVRRCLAVAVVGACAFLPNQAAGQSLSFSPGSSVGTGTTLGTAPLSPNPRFERRNRRRVGFIGADRRDLRGFVGAAQAVAPAQGTTVTPPPPPRPPRSPNVNRPRRPDPANSPYSPTLTWAGDLFGGASDEAAASTVASLSAARRAAERLDQLPPFEAGTEVRVSVAGTSVVLDGVVPSADLRRLAEQVMLFEPGVNQIVNRLRVAPPQTLPPPPRDR